MIRDIKRCLKVSEGVQRCLDVSKDIQRSPNLNIINIHADYTKKYIFFNIFGLAE